MEEWSVVAARARRTEEKINVGRIFPIVSEKNSEMAPEHRKMKGRIVFQGSNVRDEFNAAAVFADLSSAPATMQAGKACDSIGMLPGNQEELADAVQAYIQCRLKGTKTVVRLPKNLWPPTWSGMVDPVCPLLLSLYGHPSAGGFWEEFSSNHVLSCGFVRIPNWRSSFWHPTLQVFLIIYVDDFKASGPPAGLKVARA